MGMIFVIITAMTTTTMMFTVGTMNRYRSYYGIDWTYVPAVEEQPVVIQHILEQI